MLVLPFDVTEHSVRPVRLVRITRRDGTVLRIADSQGSQVVPDDGTYTPLAGFNLKAIKSALGGAVPSTAVEFAHASGATLDTSDLVNGLYDGATVEVFAADREQIALGVASLCAGTIQGVEVSLAGSGSFTIKGQSATSETYIRTYLPTCDTDLFSPLCTLVHGDYVRTTSIDEIIDPYNVTFSEYIVDPGDPPVPLDEDFFFNDGTGLTENGQTFRIAVSFESGQITTYVPNTFMFEVGMIIQMWPGCDKTHATCHERYDNTANFQGFPHFLGALAATVQS